MLLREMELPLNTTRNHSVCLYYNQLEPREHALVTQSHLMVEFNIFNEGCHGTYRIQNQLYSIEPGDVFVIRSNEEHSIVRMEPAENCTCVGMHFSLDALLATVDEVCQARRLREWMTCLDRPFCHKLDLCRQECSEIKRLLQEIEKEFSNKSGDYEIMVKSKLMCICVLIARGVECGDEKTEPNPINHENQLQIENAMKYMEEHLAEGFTLAQLAQVSNMSESYFSHLFRQMNGLSVWDYVLTKRIARGQELLLKTDSTMLEIAIKCGFNNSANFNRAFKKISGMTPTEFKRTAKVW